MASQKKLRAYHWPIHHSQQFSTDEYQHPVSEAYTDDIRVLDNIDEQYMNIALQTLISNISGFNSRMTIRKDWVADI